MTGLKKTIVGKVGNKKRLYEADANLTPEKISELVTQATKDADDLKKIYTSFRSKVEKVSIASMLKNPSEAENLHEKLRTAKDYAKQQYEYYFNIDVRQLDKLTDKLDNLQINLGYIYNAMDYMVDAAKDFNKFYQVEDEQS